MAAPSPSEQYTLSDLASIISSNATVVDEELGSKEFPPLDDETFPGSFPLLSPEGSRARFELLSAALTLFRLASGPSETLDHVTMKGFELGTIATLLRLRIPEHIPIGSAVSLKTLSQLTSIDIDLLTRLIRYAISTGFLTEPEPGLIRHNALSAATARDHNMRDSALWNVIVGAPGGIKMYEALQLDPTGKDNTKTGLSVAMEERGEPRGTMWDYHALHPEDEVRFNNAMASTETVSIHACEHVVRGFDWSKVKTVVDVGGNEGHLCMAIINTYPHITATIQDQSRVVATSAPLLPPKYTHSITFKEHDFFHPQPTIADLYILRFILHDWSDDKARDIIRNLLPALKPGARILIVDHVVPSVGVGAGQKINKYMEQIIRQMDVAMFGLLAGRERSVEDFERLFGEVEERLVFRGCGTPDGSSLSILEFQFLG